MQTLKNAYSLRLANGQAWTLIATNGLNSWLKAFARILELEPCQLNGRPKIIFTKGHKKPAVRPKLNLPFKYPFSGWQRLNLGTIQFWQHKDLNDIICEVSNLKNNTLKTINMMQALRGIYNKIIKQGGFPFHCGLLEKDGQAVLVSAPGNTGKSTCCQRVPKPWTAQADDAAVIVKHHGLYFVHPFPTWSDYLNRNSSKTWQVAKSFPLKAIFFIEQTKGREEAIPIWAGQAVILVNQQISLTPCFSQENKKAETAELNKLVFNNACELAKQIPCYILKVHIRGKFWQQIEKILASNPKPIKKPVNDSAIKLYTPKLAGKRKESDASGQ